VNVILYLGNGTREGNGYYGNETCIESQLFDRFVPVPMALMTWKGEERETAVLRISIRSSNHLTTSVNFGTVTYVACL